MKFSLPVLTLALLSASFLSVVAPAQSPTEIARVEVHPSDNGQMLVNPQMGWIFHFYSNILDNYGGKLPPSDTLDNFPGLSSIYLRLPWSYIEPEEGRFQWSVVDTPAQRWIDKGMQVGFRFTACESWLRYATPQWVQDAGAKGHNFSQGKLDEQGPYWEPDYGDPVFLEKLRHFLEAAARRYDGNPNVAFIDVGSFGVWGEGHTWSSAQLQYPAEVIKQHLDLHASIFKHTLLAANDDLRFLGASAGDRDESVIVHAQQLGMTLRDDSICVQPPPKSYFSDKMASGFWQHVPVILETEHYGGSVHHKAWSSEAILQSIEDYHASYLSIHWFPHEFLEKERPTIDRVNLRLGYRLQLREASWPATVRRNESIGFRSAWANVGVAPCYPGGFVAFTLKDAAGGIAAVFVNEAFDLRSLETAPPGKAVAQAVESVHGLAPNMPAGEFDVFVSVGLRDGTPKIALPLEDGDGHRRYRLGRVRVVGD